MMASAAADAAGTSTMVDLAVLAVVGDLGVLLVEGPSICLFSFEAS